MADLLTRRPIPGTAVADPARPSVSYRTDVVTAALGVWFVVGLFLDAWAHNNLTELETFFTPWHAVFYSGFAVISAWIGWAVLREIRSGRRGPAAVPLGYGLAVLGIPIFAVAGAGDLVWHSVFGIETNLDILFSPTHVGLIASMALIVTAPLRSAWADPATTARPTLVRLLPAVVSLAFATSLVLLFAQYANALLWGPQGVVEALSRSTDNGIYDGPSPIALVSSVTVTNVLLLVPLLLLARRWRVPPGTATVLFLAVAGLVGAVTAFQARGMIFMVVLAGVCVDGLLAWLRPGPATRGRLLAFAALASLVTWGLYVGVASIEVGRVPAVPELWTGLPVVAALHGLILGVLAAPHRVPAAAAANVDAEATPRS